jgi:hypothetical protein
MSDILSVGREDVPRVWVAMYNHEYGTDTRVFNNESAALHWRELIARDWWDDSFPDEDMPEEDVGESYFRAMNDTSGFPESFLIIHAMVEDSVNTYSL